MSVYKSISYNLQAMLGKRTDRKILVIESDDWGSIRMPSNKAYENLKNASIAVDNCPFNTFDTLETGVDIEALNDLCQSFKDKNGNPLKLTANFIMSNPDFEKIETANFEEYHYRNLKETYVYYQGNKKTLEAVYGAMRNNVIVPQLHGREHLQVNHWLNALQLGDLETHIAFDSGVFGHPSTYSKRTGINFLSAFHVSSKQELEFVGNSVLEGAVLFNNTFGFTSKTFIAPRYIWPVELEPYFKQIGIKELQGKIVQLSPKIVNSTIKLQKRINWSGRKNIYGLNYLIRNVFFEPALSPTFNWEADALNRINTSFFWGKPAIISMHRINFVGGLSEENRAQNLKRLKSLIDAVVKMWPEIEFLGSHELEMF